jgi:hypothetical protein
LGILQGIFAIVIKYVVVKERAAINKVRNVFNVIEILVDVVSLIQTIVQQQSDRAVRFRVIFVVT